METKKCIVCQKDFEKKIDCSNYNWGKQKCCSRQCAALLLKENNKGICSNTGRTHFKKGVSGSPETEFKKGSISYWKGKSNPYFTGPNNPKWKGGISPEHLKVRWSVEMKNFRNEIFKRDNYTCKTCKRRCKIGDKVILNVHHIKSFAIHKELRFDKNNVITLCQKCHRKTKTYGKNTTI
jgi:5-methylcytosine-specific restriction protein A